MDKKNVRIRLFKDNSRYKGDLFVSVNGVSYKIRRGVEVEVPPEVAEVLEHSQVQDERTAFFKAVYDGHRDFTAIAVCGGKDGVITGAFPPCGVCRQVMREFCGDDFLLYFVTPEGYETHTLAEVLPFSFSAKIHMQP